jgi:hypothetical protein
MKNNTGHYCAALAGKVTAFSPANFLIGNARNQGASQLPVSDASPSCASLFLWWKFPAIPTTRF